MQLLYRARALRRRKDCVKTGALGQGRTPGWRAESGVTVGVATPMSSVTELAPWLGTQTSPEASMAIQEGVLRLPLW